MEAQGGEHRLIPILAADVVGYSRLKGDKLSLKQTTKQRQSWSG